MPRRIFASLLCLLILLTLVWPGHNVAQIDAQELVTSTPVRANLPELPPPPGVDDGNLTATPIRTPTPVGPVLLEAKTDAGDVNVRAEPDINGELLGTIRAGDTYPVLGRYFRWIQFQYDGAPTGTVRAWVFDELVNLTGDTSVIPDLDPNAQPTEDVDALTATAFQGALETTPGLALTATADARNLSLSGAQIGEVGGSDEATEAAVLPTFTFPADLVAAAPTQSPSGILEGATVTPRPNPVSTAMPADLPPIVPIVTLGGLGLLGLLISSLRR